MDPLTTLARTPAVGFLFSEPAADLPQAADIAFLGIPYGSPYSFHELVNDQANGPRALRDTTDRIIRSIEHYDFDLGGPLYDGRHPRLLTAATSRHVGDPSGHLRRAEQAVRHLLRAGALPIILGGDHAIPIPVLRAYADQGPITLVQIDQHIDWRDEVNGVREGLSSPIRRASEMPHVERIFQIGLRGTGSARDEEVEAARAYGAELVTAYELHEKGIEAIVARIPDGGRYYLDRGHGRNGPVHRAGGGSTLPGRRDLPASATPDPRAGAQGPGGRDGRSGDHPVHGCEPHHLHHRGSPDREPDRRRGASWVFRPVAVTPARQVASAASGSTARTT